MFEVVTQKKSVGSRLLPWIVIVITALGLWLMYIAAEDKKPAPKPVAPPAATASPAPPSTAPAPPTTK